MLELLIMPMNDGDEEGIDFDLNTTTEVIILEIDDNYTGVDEVAISEGDDNALEVRSDGLYVPETIIETELGQTNNAISQNIVTNTFNQMEAKISENTKNTAPSTKNKNRLVQENDGLYVSDDLIPDPLAYYILSKT